MIVNEKHGTVLTSQTSTTEFGLELNAKAFEILSAGIYSDKVRAIIRELSTNAADAHAAANNPQPFVVHLPNQLEPWFAVTDFGTGLDDDQVRGSLTPEGTRKGGIYTTYFKSNKTNSNDFTGCLGLGSKSPFAYTDTFTVESRYNGTKRIYSAFLSEKRVPTVALMSETNTDEPNGLTISFPVKSADFWAFQQKAQQTLSWFKIRPKVTGFHDFKFIEHEYLIKNKNFAVTTNKTNNSYVVMGNIAYPIEPSEFLQGYEPHTEKLKSLVRWGIEIYVNVGDVDIAASREKLSYDKTTVKLLTEKLQQALKDLETEVTKDIQNQPTIWKARQALTKIRNSFQNFDFKAEWNGETIQPFVKIGSKIVDQTNVPNAKLDVMTVKNHRSNNSLVVKTEKGETIHADDTPIFINDDRGAISKVRHYLLGKPRNTKVYLLSDCDQQWLKETGLDQVAVKASTLPQPPKATATARAAAQKAKVYLYTPEGNANNGSSQAASYWTPAEIDLDQGGVYVEILYFNYRMKDGETTGHPSDLKYPLKKLQELGKDVKIYGIRPADKTILDKSQGEWLTLREFAVETIKELHHYNNELLKIEQLKNAFGGSLNYNATFDWYSLLAKQTFQPNSKMTKLLQTIIDAKLSVNNKKAQTYGELRDWTLGSFNFKEQETNQILLMLRDVLKTYPLLTWIEKSTYNPEQKLQAILQYVELVDQNNANANAA